MVTWTHYYDNAQVVIIPADIEATIEEVFGKPGLGIEDSTGLMDYDALTQAELDELTDEYVDWQDDVAWLRWGC